MIFGLNLPNYSSLGHRDAVTAIAERADELGYASLWTSDHVLLPETLPEPYGNLLESFTTLSYLAARTRRIGLATGILVLPQRDPLLAAKQAATIHHLSGGRLTLGVGVGWIEQEYGYLRSDFSARGQIADEYIPAMRTLFEDERPEFHGPRINYSDILFSPKPSPRLCGPTASRTTPSRTSPATSPSTPTEWTSSGPHGRRGRGPSLPGRRPDHPASETNRR
jgi:alkanesulfonate monooxygenase SsuD/methylene tetrahydromethanopterin reductase-like flavin-dependent oxidoreductase (luciferase family)